jgi:hypothetical protein
MIEWTHDFINNKSTFVYSIISITVMLSASKFLANVAATNVLDQLKKKLNIEEKKDV